MLGELVASGADDDNNRKEHTGLGDPIPSSFFRVMCSVWS